MNDLDRARADLAHAEKMLAQDTRDRYHAYGWHLDVPWFERMRDRALMLLGGAS